MEFLMERWYMAAGQRFSVRKYSDSPSGEDIRSLLKTAKMLEVSNMRVAIGFCERIFSSLFMGLGRIKGTDCFAAFIGKDTEPAAVGYLGEAFILECTALGLGTCWLGAFHKGKVAKVVKTEKGEEIACITAVGVAAEPYAARPRKSLQTLTGLNNKQLTELPEWQLRALECARLAPSAVNAQPYEFIVEDGSIGIRRISPNFGYGEVDCGIAMLHIELGAAHAGVSGKWDKKDDYAIFVPIAYDR
ncbi:MAG: Nitroreductase family protein [Firmicutes bacterium ADurb.Bin182]|nr:MAG: Nitroreductase family protein [Firmicutes bacterium ADurb.Bin182]